MSKKSKKSYARKQGQRAAIDRPFDPATLSKAREVASRYTVILTPDPDLGHLGKGLEFPYAMGGGRTPDECVTQTREAFVAAVATMLEMGQVPPSPASDTVRTEQVNIRLTPEEKLRLEEAARNKGFRGISDFVRSASLASAS